MNRYITFLNNNTKHICIFLIAVFVSSIANAQKIRQYRKYDSIYISKGINEIAWKVTPNGWIKFDAKHKLSKDNLIDTHKQKLGLGTDDKLVLKQITSDNIGYKHYRYTQRYKGIKVEFSEIILHEQDGIITKTSGRNIPNINVRTTPSLSASIAFNKMTDYLSDNLGISLLTNHKYKSAIKPELVILPAMESIDNDYLAYKFEVYNGKPYYEAVIYINAHNGKVLLVSSETENANATGYACKIFSGTDLINTEYTESTYRLHDYTRGAGIVTKDMQMRTDYNTAVDIYDADNNWADCTNPGHDAHYALQKTYDYYMLTFGRNSFDNKGTKINAYVNYDDHDYCNAGWRSATSSNPDLLRFGSCSDGNKVVHQVCMDIVAHEFTHGVNRYSAQLALTSFECKALMESFCDIFGTIIKFKYDDNPNWLWGDKSHVDKSKNRDFEDPHRMQHAKYYGDKYWTSITDPKTQQYVRAGVQNHWFYLLCNGGSDTRIGMDKAAAVAYRNLTVYLFGLADYKDSRQGSIEAAMDLFGECSNEVEKVMNAWDAVGVFAPDVTVNSTFCEMIHNVGYDIDPYGSHVFAQNNIVAGGQECGNSAIIPSGDRVILRAGNSVRLKKGFHAKRDCHFKASVVDCGGGIAKSGINFSNVRYTDEYTNEHEVANEDQLEVEISENIMEPIYHVYPNPSDGNISLFVDNYNNDQLLVEILSFTGAEIHECTVTAVESSINISGSATGVYFMRITDNTNTTVKRIVIE